VLSCAADRAVEGEIIASLTAKNLTSRPLAEGSTARVVAIVSGDATSDDSWLRAVADLAADRIVPVRVGDVNAARVPTVLRDLNWIDWHPQDAASHAQIFIALHSDPATYAQHRRLHAEAVAWASGGRSPSLLLQSRAAAVDAVRHIRDADGDQLAQADQVMRDFVAASDASTRKVSRRTRRAWTAALLVVAVVAVVTAFVFVTLRTAGRSNNLAALGSTAPEQLDHRGARPDRAVERRGTGAEPR
jgi:hypothetical protein